MSLRKNLRRILIDVLNVNFSKFDGYVQGVNYIGSHGVLRSDDQSYMQDWDNKLHPTFSAFKSIMD